MVVVVGGGGVLFYVGVIRSENKNSHRSRVDTRGVILSGGGGARGKGGVGR